MPTAEIKHFFPISAERLWGLIGDFGDMGKWSGRPPGACVQSGVGVGALRIITLDDGRQIVDRLTAEGPMTYSYCIVSSPLPMKTYQATMAVTPVSDAASELTWSGEFEPAGLSDADAIAFVENMYRYGISLMQKTLA